MIRHALVLALLALPCVAVAQEGVFTTRPNAKPQLVPLPKEEGVFHFVIFGDRTGGPDEGIAVLRQAVRDTNLLDPDLVMTVGDLINGYNTTPQWMMQMREYRSSMAKLRMPWFPVAGNHDIYWRGPDKPPGEHERDYEMHFGPLWYAFKHKNAGFIAVYSDEGDPTTGEKAFQGAKFQNVSPEQLDFLREALTKLKDCDHVFLFLHHPRWLGGRNYGGSNWDEVHELLKGAGNVSAVFGGHIHQMTYAGAKDGIEYFTLASVGAYLDEELPPAGYLHHINVVTVRKDGFHVAAIPVGQTIDPREFTLERIEDIEKVAKLPVERKSEPIRFQPGRPPGHGTYTIALTNPAARPIEVTLDASGAGPVWRFLPDHQHFVIDPGKTQIAAFRYRYEAVPTPSDFANPGLTMQVEYLAETARVPLPVRQVPIDFEFVSPADGQLDSPDENNVLALSGNGALRVEADAYELPDGPFTLEAWVNPSSIEESQSIVAKTQNSEYAIFLHDGLPDFSVHLGGDYATVKADRKLETNRWTHVAGVYTGDEVILYVDGEPVKRIPASGARRRNELPLYLGADPGDDGQRTRPFAGQIDEVRLSKVARYFETFEPKRRLEPDNETVLHYAFDAAFGPFAIDDSEPFVPAKLDGEAHLAPAETGTGE